MKKEDEINSQDIKKSLKATSLFGGMQIFSIVVSVVRTKIIAVLIGPVGVGIVELYNSTINLIRSFTDFSLQVSAVRDVSIAYKSGDEQNFSIIVSVFSKIVWFTGLLGTLVCFLGSPLWSKLTFGNYTYTIGFMLLSVVLLFSQLQTGKSVILQGTEHYKYLAYSGVIGNVLGLITTVPIYYFLGLDGIVPVIIITAATGYILSCYYANKVKYKKNNLPNKEVYHKGAFMLKQGALISVNYLFSALVFYILRVFITNKGGVSELGLYTASFAIVNTYVGLVFKAMGQEYYPRLSTLTSDMIKFRQAVNNQIYLILLVLGPFVAIFLSFSNNLLTLLYSDKFVEASTLMAISMVGVIFQAPSWCMAYTMLAKGDNRTFLIFETVAKVVRILMDIVFYLIWGLTGLGISFLLSYIYYTIQCSVVCNKRYQFRISGLNISLLLIYLIVGLISIVLYEHVLTIHRILIGSFIILITLWFSYYRLNKIINVKELVYKILKR